MSECELTKTEQENLAKVRDDLYSAFVDGDVVTGEGHAAQLAANLVAMAIPRCPVPDNLELFSFTVGYVLGATAQKYDDLAYMED